MFAVHIGLSVLTSCLSFLLGHAFATAHVLLLMSDDTCSCAYSKMKNTLEKKYKIMVVD